MSTPQGPSSDPGRRGPSPDYPPGRRPETELEGRIEEEERQIGTNRVLALVALALGVLLVIAVSALVAGLVALNRDVEAVGAARPAEDSVGTAALEDDAVTAEKIAAGAVSAEALALQVVTEDKVAPDSLTGVSILESALGTVPKAAQAENAAALGGTQASGYLSAINLVEAVSGANDDDRKGPITATCPAGTNVLAGGASVEGASSGVAIVASAPSGTNAWAGTAEAFAAIETPWRLVVTVVCATGGR